MSQEPQGGQGARTEHGGKVLEDAVRRGPQCHSDHLLGLTYVANILLGTLNLFSAESHK